MPITCGLKTITRLHHAALSSLSAMTTYAKDKRLATALDGFIQANLDKKLTVEVLSMHLGVSRFTLQRVCRLIYGKPVYGFILDKRFKKAYALIRETGIPVKQIAAMTGFKSVTTFTSSFRRKFKITPGALRNEG